MTKTLTKQWREHNLKYKQNYYLLLEDGGEDIQPFMGGFFMSESNEVKEVLAPVPSYDKLQTKDMLLDSYKKENKRLKAVAEHCENIAGKWADKLFDTERKVERLQEQLNEANNVIKYYGMGVVTVTGYWGDKPYTRPEETTSFPEKALEYLKKWGVK